MRKLTCASLMAVALIALSASSAFATHFRYGTITWNPVAGTRTINYTVTSSWRRSYYVTNFGINPTVGGAPVDTGVQFCFTAGSTDCVEMIVTVNTVNAAEDWFVGTFTTSKTYPSNGTYFANFLNCCRVSAPSAGGTLQNNGDNNFQVWSNVTVALGPTPNRPPTSSILPVVFVPTNTSNVTFIMPAFDADGDTMTFRLATGAELGLAGEIQPPGFAVNATTGVITFNTIGKPAGQLWNAQVVITDSRGAATAVDFLLQVLAAPPAGSHPPTALINDLPTAQVFVTRPGTPVSFVLKGTDVDPGSTVTLSASGTPTGATFSPALPTTGIPPYASTFNWTPGPTQVGSFSVTVAATDNFSVQDLNVAQINVIINDPPAWACPAPLTVQATSLAGASVTSSISIADLQRDPFTVGWFLDGSPVATQTNTVPGVIGPTALSLLRTLGIGAHTLLIDANDGKLDGHASCTTTITVTNASQTIAFTPPSKAYGDAPFALAATATSGLPVTLAFISGPGSLSGNSLTITGAGDIVIEASQGGAGFYAAATSVLGTVHVAPASLVITAENKSKTYGSANPTLTASYAGFVNGDTAAGLDVPAALSTTADASSGVGGYPIAVSGALDANYSISFAGGTLSVSAASLTITADDKSKTYGDGNPTLTASYLGFVNGDTAANLDVPAVLSTAATASSGVAGYPITVGGAADANYSISFVDGTLTVNQALLTITADNKSKTYGSANPALTASYSGFVNGDLEGALDTPVVLSTTADSSSAFGTYPITASGAADVNYSISVANGTLTVDPAILTITADNKSKTYGSANPTLTAGYSGFVNGDTEASLDTPVTLSTAADPSSAFGTYPITASGAADANYTISFVNGTLTVTQAVLSISADDKSRPYGSANPTLTASYSGFVNGDTEASLDTPVTLSTAADPSSVFGTYPITASGAADANYTISFANGTLTVTQAVLTITADSKSKTYGSANPALTASYSGFVNGDTEASLDTPVTLSTTAGPSSVFGVYPITANGATDANYTISFVNGTLTVGQAVLTITADNKGKTYGSANPALTASYSGFVNGDTAASLDTPAVLTTAANPSSAVGGYPIGVTAALDANYSISFVSGTLTVTAAPLTVKANDASKQVGAVNPAFTATTTGFVNGDDAGDLSGTLTFTTTATTASPAGTYPITPAGLTSSNYQITFTNGILTVSSDPDGKMYGAGHIEDGRKHHHFVFRVSQLRTREYARLEYWVVTDGSRYCSDHDDDDNRDGDNDREYGRSHQGGSNHFEATSIASVTFSNDPAFSPERRGRGPRPSVDTVVFVGTGKWNGRSGYTFEARATDQGEPGRHRDTFSLVVRDSRGIVVANVSDSIDRGNIQSTRLNGWGWR